jgi:hypothetical protein
MISFFLLVRSLTLGVALLLAPITTLAQQTTVVHGADSIFSGSGVKLAWAVRRGTSEAETSVVIRAIPADVSYRFIRVDGVDPFTQDRKVFVATRQLDRQLDLIVPRAAFADHPSTEFRFFASAGDAEADRPKLTVFYLGVPDTTPEFVGESEIDGYLGQMLR